MDVVHVNSDHESPKLKGLRVHSDFLIREESKIESEGRERIFLCQTSKFERNRSMVTRRHSGRRTRNFGRNYTIKVSVEPVKQIAYTIQVCLQACGGAALYFQSYYRGSRIAFASCQVAFQAT